MTRRKVLRIVLPWCLSLVLFYAVSRNVEWRALSGRGRLYSHTRVHATASAFAADAPYDLALVDLAEGLRVALRWTGEGRVALDGPIQLVVLAYDDGPLFAARPFA